MSVLAYRKEPIMAEKLTIKKVDNKVNLLAEKVADLAKVFSDFVTPKTCDSKGKSFEPVKRDFSKPEWHTYEFKDGNYEIATADENGVLVFRDAIFEAPFDDKDDWRKCTNDWNKCTLKPLLEKWWEENAPQVLKDNYDVDLLNDYEIFDKDQMSEDYRIGNQLAMFKDWHNRIKGLKGNRYSTWWWTKTALRGYVYLAFFVFPTGYRNFNYAYTTSGVVPCLRPKHQ